MLPYERQPYEEATQDLDEELVEQGRILEEDDALDWPARQTDPSKESAENRNAPATRAGSGRRVVKGSLPNY